MAGKKTLEITPRGPLDAVVRVPGSKSITNRALLVAALAEGTSELRGGLRSDDTAVMLEVLEKLGCKIDVEGEVENGNSFEPETRETKASGETWRVQGCGGQFREPDVNLYVENSGTTARFITAAATLCDGPSIIEGNPRMHERPIEDLVRAPTQLGAKIEIQGGNGCPPLCVEGGGLPGGEASIDASRSSQYVSAVLLSAPYAKNAVTLRFAGGELVSRPYVELTLDVMRDFGAAADWLGTDGLRVGNERGYKGRTYDIEPDASAAAYPFCAAAIAGGRVRVEGIPLRSHQADFALLDILEKMGCEIQRGEGFAEVRGASLGLSGIDVDMNDLPDATLALAVVALFARGTTRIRNVANLRIKETDRLAALETELCKLGANAHADADSLIIEPGPLTGAEIDTYDDHRMAMALLLAGLRVPGVVIRDPGCVSKTWPEYFAFLARMTQA